MKTLPLRHFVWQVILLMLSLIWLTACARPEPAAGPTPLVELMVTAPLAPTPSSTPRPTATPTVTPTPTPLPSPTPARLSLTALQNATYTLVSQEGRQVRLVDGVFDDLDPDWPYHVEIDPRSPVFGDLNGDGQGDALVLLYSYTGGTGQFFDLAWMVNKAGQPHSVRSIFLGDRVQVKAITIDESGVTLDLLTHGPNDGACCPTVSKIEHYDPLPR